MRRKLNTCFKIASLIILLLKVVIFWGLFLQNWKLFHSICTGDTVQLWTPVIDEGCKGRMISSN